MKTFITSALIFSALDFLWLGILTKDFYPKYIGHLMTTDVNWLAAVLFYFIYLLGLNYFILWPKSVSKPRWLQGALLGFLCYATYDFTNMATLQNFSWIVVVVDCAWGAFATGLCAGLTAKIAKLD